MPTSHATLDSQTEYTDQTFVNVHLDGGQLISSGFYDCHFKDCIFIGATLRDSRFFNCVFQGCDLSLVQFPESIISGARFVNSKLVGIDWTLAKWSATRLGEPLSFKECILNHATFIGLSLIEMKMHACFASDVDFREADLTRADFADTDLSKALFGETDLTQADLSRARNYHIDAGRNVLKQARFSLPEAMSLLYSLDIILIEEGE